MKFIDEAMIIVHAGDGGAGCVSFRRERFIPMGGPDGGDGGKGGDVIFQTTSSKRTLGHLRYKKHFNASKGTAGQGSQKTGKKGADLIIELPPGTLISDAETGELLNDFTTIDDSYIIAKGGRGGQGNRRFKSSTNRSPKFAQPGEAGQTLSLNLELKLLADVGIIGLPNAGKSTLISALSAARPKIANYPFTTLVPSLGVVHTGWGEPFIMADIPGLIQGAHKGAGLGIQFLRHIERTRVLIHLIDAAALDIENPLKPYEIINQELASYSSELAKKPQLIVLNKIDLEPALKLSESFTAALLPEKTIFLISAAASTGLNALKSAIIKLLDSLNEPSQ